jgi:hypothetical protein
MRRIRMHYIDTMLIFHVTFMEGNRVWGNLSFNSEEPIFEMMRRAHNPVEDHQIVENTIRERCPGVVELRLDDEQFASLVKRLGRRLRRRLSCRRSY